MNDASDGARAYQAATGIWGRLGGDREALARLTIGTAEPLLPSTYRIEVCAAASTGVAALAASEVDRLRNTRTQGVDVDPRAASVAFRSERYLRIDGESPGDVWVPTVGFYPTGDGQWVQLHTNFPHHRDGTLAMLDCPDDREAVARAVGARDAQGLEDEGAERGLCITRTRGSEEWRAHPQAAAIASLPLIEVTRLDDSPRAPAAPADLPLEGIRVLDLTQVIAGPVCGRALAAYGAEVLRIAAPHFPNHPTLHIDTGFGKRSAHLDLREREARERLAGLVGDADVFVQGYRPGTIAGRGFSPRQVADLRPGVVYVSLSAYGRSGPWRARRGFDSLVQNASGIARGEAIAAGTDRPKHLPCQALDHASGYLMAAGALVGLARRIESGGSWHVQVSLARTGRWIESLGRVEGGLDRPDPGIDDVSDRLDTCESEYGEIRFVTPAVPLSDTGARWMQPPVPAGTHPPRWFGE